MSFTDDIQGRNTQLYPIVVIYKGMPEDWEVVDFSEVSKDFIFLSTNSTEIGVGTPEVPGDDDIALENLTDFTFGTRHCKPIVLDIPTVKEKIDVKTKRFTISNVKLNLSNYEYDGESFSDILLRHLL